jgi:hypothetical protein
MACSTRKTKQIDLWMERRVDLRPHPEERPSGRVSKDGRNTRSLSPSFETRAVRAPQSLTEKAVSDFSRL